MRVQLSTMSLSMKVRGIGVPVGALEGRAVEGVERGIDVEFDWELAGVDSALEQGLHDRLARLATAGAERAFTGWHSNSSQ